MFNCLVIGDMGKGTEDQYNVARSMVKLRNKYKTKFILGLGDNIYPNGCETIDDQLFQTNLEESYSILPNDRWYMCLSNHYGYQRNISSFKDNSNSQVEYTDYSENGFNI